MSTDIDTIRSFDREHGAGYWDLEEELGRFYDWNGPTRLYDDMDPQHRLARTPAEYRGIWEPTFNSLQFAEHRVEDGPDVIVSGDLASSWLVFIALLITEDGTRVRLRSTNTLVWQRRAGGWTIVRDHTSSQHIGEDELQRLLTDLPADRAAAAERAAAA